MTESPRPTTAKERILAIVEQQPDDSSFDEILQEIAFLRMVERGLADAAAGRVISHAEMIRETESWTRK